MVICVAADCKSKDAKQLSALILLVKVIQDKAEPKFLREEKLKQQ